MHNNETDSTLILIADDQPDVLEALRMLLRSEGYRIDTAASPNDILLALKRREYDAVLMDLNYTRDTTSGQEGLDILRHIGEISGDTPVVVMTAWSSVELAVEAMRRGARDFVQKPWDNARLLTTMKTQIDLGRALRANRRLEEENILLRDARAGEMIASSSAMQPVLDMIARVGPSDANVLITGEHGTGKEVAARALHSLSRRSEKPLIVVNVEACPRAFLKANFSGMCAALLRTPKPIGQEGLNWQKKARCSWMKSPTFP